MLWGQFRYNAVYTVFNVETVTGQKPLKELRGSKILIQAKKLGDSQINHLMQNKMKFRPNIHFKCCSFVQKTSNLSKRDLTSYQ